MILDTTYTTRTPRDQRVAELNELAIQEGIDFAIPVDLILWFEDRGYVVDLHTGQAIRVEVQSVTPFGRTFAQFMMMGGN